MSISRLPDSELRVMQAIWECAPPVTRKDIETRLSKTYPIAQTTLFTLLTRLKEKGFVSVTQGGKARLYTPLISQQDYLSQQCSSFIKRLCGGNISTFASALCDSDLTEQELSELSRLLERGEL